MGNLTLDSKKEIEDELEELSAICNYLEKSDRQDTNFTSLQRRDELVLIDGIKIPRILMLQNSDGVTEILKRGQKTKLNKDEIEKLSEETKLDVEDIAELIEFGMTNDEIAQAAKMIPFKENAESKAISEMIKMKIDPNQLAELKERAIQITSIEDGIIQVEEIEKIAEVDEKGLLKLDDKWLAKNESLRLYSEMGLINLSQELTVKDLPKKEYEENGDGSLEIVPLEKKKEEKTKEDIEKTEVAKSIGEEPDNILSIIQIEDRDGGSKLFNYDMDEKSKPLIVRLRNNNFKVLEEKQDGTRTELMGYEVNPAAKQVAESLKDTKGKSLFTTLKAGEIRAGKTNPNQERYDVFLVRRAGESKDDDSNNLLFVGLSGKTDMSIVENKNDSIEFQRVPISSVYPKNIYLEEGGITDRREKKEIGTNQEQEKDDNEKPNISFSDIQKRKDLLKRLMRIDALIRKIEDEKIHNADDRTDNQQEKRDRDKLSELKDVRAKMINDLGMKDSNVLELEEDHARYLGDNANKH